MSKIKLEDIEAILGKENWKVLSKEYINLNQRLNELKTEKKKLKYDFLRYENEVNYNLEKLSYKIEQLKANNKPLRKNILTTSLKNSFN